MAEERKGKGDIFFFFTKEGYYLSAFLSAEIEPKRKRREGGHLLFYAIEARRRRGTREKSALRNLGEKGKDDDNSLLTTRGGRGGRFLWNGGGRLGKRREKGAH